MEGWKEKAPGTQALPPLRAARTCPRGSEKGHGEWSVGAVALGLESELHAADHFSPVDGSATCGRERCTAAAPTALEG